MSGISSTFELFNNVRLYRSRRTMAILIMMTIIITIKEFTMNMVLRCYVGHEFEYGTQQPGKERTVDGFGAGFGGGIGTSAYYNTILSYYTYTLFSNKER